MEKIKLMICDDSHLILQSIKNVLSDYYIDIFEAKNGAECVTYLDLYEGDYDLLTLDVHMPKMSGIDVLKKLNEMDIKLPNIMMITTSNDAPTVLEACQLGASGYITKPFTKEVLIEKIDQQLEKVGKKLVLKSEVVLD